jgi:N-carbamoyl-L-amino-acid hydrolase
MQEVVAIAHRHQPYGRGTVGMVQVHPNSRNVIPGQVKFTVDLRNVNDELLDRMDGEIRACAERTGRETGLGIDHRARRRTSRPAPSTPDCVDAVRRATEKLGYRPWTWCRAPGHDAIYAARLAPAGMIFVPCKDGISHNEIEDAQARAPDGRLQRALARHAGARKARRLTPSRRRCRRYWYAASSCLAIALRCTSSGPSATRRWRS